MSNIKFDANRVLQMLINSTTHNCSVSYTQLVQIGFTNEYIEQVCDKITSALAGLVSRIGNISHQNSFIEKGKRNEVNQFLLAGGFNKFDDYLSFLEYCKKEEEKIKEEKKQDYENNRRNYKYLPWLLVIGGLTLILTSLGVYFAWKGDRHEESGKTLNPNTINANATIR